MIEGRELPWGEQDRLLRFRAERSPAAVALLGPIPRDREERVALARARVPDAARRRRAAAALLPRLAALPLPAEARASAAMLEDPATRIVIAGQQPALWGGPAMLAIKALAALRAAEELRAAGIPTVALFWIASEDHDVAELWGGRVALRHGPTVELEPPFAPGRRMLGRLAHTLPAAARMAAIEPILRAAPHGAQWRERLASTLAADPTEEFTRLWLELFGARGLLPVRPEWLRELARPAIAAELAAPGSLAALVRPAVDRLHELGLPAPIPDPAELPFFWVDAQGERHRLRSVGAGVQVGGREGEVRPAATLAAELDADPGRASPDALLRPLVQDEILEPAASVLGPTEFAYHLELVEAYRARGIPRPLWHPRPRLRVLDGEDAETLARLGIDPGVLDPGAAAAEQIASPEAERRRDALSSRGDALVALIDGWSRDADLDPALRKRCDRLGRRLRDDFRKLAEALDRGAGADVSAERRAFEEVLGRLFPGGEEWERSAALLGFLAEHGEGGLEAIHRAAAPGDGRLRLLVMAGREEACRDGV